MEEDIMEEDIMEEDIMEEDIMAEDIKRAFRAVWEAATLEEREACAKLCESLPVTDDDVADECAAAIRARSNEQGQRPVEEK